MSDWSLRFHRSCYEPIKGRLDVKFTLFSSSIIWPYLLEVQVVIVREGGKCWE